MKDNFVQCLDLVLKHEGGYVNHPSDPGGETNRGVTKRVYDAYRRSHGLPVRSVLYIGVDEVADIYRADYWNMVKGDDLPSGIDYCVFDFAVNSGVSRASKFLQMTLGVSADGVIGQHTLAAALEAEPRNTINTICDKRMVFLKSLSIWDTFGKGWSSRVAAVRFKAIDMAVAAPTEPRPRIVLNFPPASAPRPSLWESIKALFSKVLT